MQRPRIRKLMNMFAELPQEYLARREVQGFAALRVCGRSRTTSHLAIVQNFDPDILLSEQRIAYL